MLIRSGMGLYNSAEANDNCSVDMYALLLNCASGLLHKHLYLSSCGVCMAPPPSPMLTEKES